MSLKKITLRAKLLRFISSSFNSVKSRLLIRQFAKIILPAKTKGPFIVELGNNQNIKIDPLSDLGVESCLYFYGQYEIGTLNFITKCLAKGDTFFDIGANIGLMTLYASEQVGANGKVFSFEAFPKTAFELKENIRLNNLNNVTIHKVAIGDYDGTAKIFESYNKNKGMTSLVQTTKHGFSEIEIPVKRLNNFNEVKKVDLIKIDVEGFEYKVLDGAGDFFQRDYKPILIVEYDEELTGQVDSHLYDKILSLGDYKIYISKYSKESISPFIEVKNKRDLPKHENLFCIPAPRIEEVMSKGIEFM